MMQTARTQYTLPASRTPNAIRRSILRYGLQCNPTPIQPQPAALRYRFSSPITVYSRGIERVLAAYEVDFLDKDTYRSILNSAKANSKALTGKKKARFLDQKQKKQSLHRVTVILILAHQVEPQMIPNLYELVCKQCGDEQENCTIPCVVDLAHHSCVFNCLRIPFVGYGYAVKNRGIRMIRNTVFGGNLNLHGNAHVLTPIRAIDPDDSLWDFWKELHHQLVGADREIKRRFESMSEREIVMDENALYVKWDQRGICQSITLDTENKIAWVERVTHWFYPKRQPIGKKIVKKIEEHIVSHFTSQGFAAEFVHKAPNT